MKTIDDEIHTNERSVRFVEYEIEERFWLMLNYRLMTDHRRVNEAKRKKNCRR